MININSNYKYVNDLISKNNGTYMSPDEYSRYAQKASLELFNSLVGARNVPQTVYGRNRVLDSRLRPFRKEASIVFANSKANLPADCKHILAMYDSARVPIKPMDEDRKTEVLRDPLAKPDSRDKYYSEGDTDLELLGVTALSCTIEYLREPARPVFGYTNPTGRRAVYDPTTSTNFDWDETMEDELTNRILSKVGLSMSNNTVIQVSNNNIAKE